MRDLSSEFFASFCIVAVLLSQLVAEAATPCSTIPLFGSGSCGETETCVQLGETGECRCRRSYQRENGKCVLRPITTESSIESNATKQDSGDSSGGGSIAAQLLIPLFLISLAVVIFFSARRYKWVQRFRQYQQNRYSNVLVTRDDDDDDPPIV